MITITYRKTDKSLLSTESVPDVKKDDLFSAFFNKDPWLVCNATYQIVGLKASPVTAASQTLAVTCKFLQWNYDGE